MRVALGLGRGVSPPSGEIDLYRNLFDIAEHVSRNISLVPG
jgi:hypothetical protein